MLKKERPVPRYSTALRRVPCGAHPFPRAICPRCCCIVAATKDGARTVTHSCMPSDGSLPAIVTDVPLPPGAAHSAEAYTRHPFRHFWAMTCWLHTEGIGL